MHFAYHSVTDTGSAAQERIRVLFVDDHLETREYISELLSQSGYEVTTADSYAAGVTVAQSGDFDVYLLDILLPDGSGIELCRTLQWLTPGIPSVFYTGHTELDKKSRERCGRWFLIKPAPAQEIERAIREAVGTA